MARNRGRSAIINTVSKDLEKYRRDTVKKIRILVQDHAKDVEIAAYRDLTKGSSRPDLIDEFREMGLNFINIDIKFSKGGLKAEIGVMGDNDMAAYIEFGTGLSAREILADYPKWIRDIAWTFKKKADGTLVGSPYLYNNWLRIIPLFEKELKELLKKQVKS